MPIYENRQFQPQHYISPYSRPVDYFGADTITAINPATGRPYMNVTGGVMMPDVMPSIVTAEIDAKEDPYILGLHELADKNRNDPAAVALIMGEIKNATAQTAAAIQAGRGRTPQKSLSLLDQFKTLLSRQTGGNANTSTPKAAAAGRDNTPVILAGAAAAALVIIAAVR